MQDVGCRVWGVWYTRTPRLSVGSGIEGKHLGLVVYGTAAHFCKAVVLNPQLSTHSSSLPPSLERQSCTHPHLRAVDISANLVHPTPHTPHPTPYTLRLTPCTLLSTPDTLRHTPHTLQPAPYTLYPTSHTLHPSPYTLHPTPYTLHPYPETRNPCRCLTRGRRRSRRSLLSARSPSRGPT